MGKLFVRTEVIKDGDVIKNAYKDPAYLFSMNSEIYSEQRNSLLVSFLSGVTGMDYKRENEKIKFSIASCIENIYFLRNLNLVLPYTFVANLVQSYTSGSKTVSVINGKTTGNLFQSRENTLGVGVLIFMCMCL